MSAQSDDQRLLTPAILALCTSNHQAYHCSAVLSCPPWAASFPCPVVKVKAPTSTNRYLQSMSFCCCMIWPSLDNFFLSLWHGSSPPLTGGVLQREDQEISWDQLLSAWVVRKNLFFFLPCWQFEHSSSCRGQIGDRNSANGGRARAKYGRYPQAAVTGWERKKWYGRIGELLFHLRWDKYQVGCFGKVACCRTIMSVISLLRPLQFLFAKKPSPLHEKSKKSKKQKNSKKRTVYDGILKMALRFWCDLLPSPFLHPLPSPLCYNHSNLFLFGSTT